jgi:hypothetical protein
VEQRNDESLELEGLSNGEMRWGSYGVLFIGQRGRGCHARTQSNLQTSLLSIQLGLVGDNRKEKKTPAVMTPSRAQSSMRHREDEGGWMG